MKLVIQTPEGTKAQVIKEYELGQTIEHIKATFSGTELDPLQYELFRYKLDKGANK